MNTKTLFLLALTITILNIQTVVAHNDGLSATTKKNERLAFFLKKDHNGNTFLHQATSDHALEAARIICRAAHQEGVLEEVITALNGQHQTPLHIAVETKQINLIQLMCELAWQYGFLERLLSIKDYNNYTVRDLSDVLHENSSGYFRTIDMIGQYHKLLEQQPPNTYSKL